MCYDLRIPLWILIIRETRILLWWDKIISVILESIGNISFCLQLSVSFQRCVNIRSKQHLRIWRLYQDAPLYSLGLLTVEPLSGQGDLWEEAEPLPRPISSPSLRLYDRSLSSLTSGYQRHQWRMSLWSPAILLLTECMALSQLLSDFCWAKETCYQYAYVSNVMFSKIS